MGKESSEKLIKKLVKRTIGISIFFALMIAFFTTDILYCIMFACGALISLAGFFTMIKVVDRLLEKKKGRVLFFLVSFAKLVLISVVSIVISRYSESYFLYFIFGLSLIVISLMIEGGFQLYRSIRHGS